MNNKLVVLDKTMIKNAAPKGMRTNITDDMVKTINDIISDPEMCEEYRDNILGYMDVLKEGRWRFGDYISAVKYVSYKLRGDSNIAAYTKTFPEKVAKFQSRPNPNYSSWVTSYGKSKLVNEILGRSLIPTHVLNADIYQKAINVQAQLMTTADSEKVRTDAANSLLNHLKPPETSKIEIDMNVKQQDGIGDLREATLELVKAQRLAIEAGQNTAKEIAHTTIVLDMDVEEAQIVP